MPFLLLNTELIALKNHNRRQSTSCWMEVGSSCHCDFTYNLGGLRLRGLSTRKVFRWQSRLKRKKSWSSSALRVMYNFVGMDFCESPINYFTIDGMTFPWVRLWNAKWLCLVK